ncbi:hypothetical protein BD769DRAFT_1397700 [Suillus cothurnatus]|nr:hypothetical protein BD769DRAFT_1397700 [Suillus cothurnatus]
MLGWPGDEQQLESQTRDHNNPWRFLYIDNAVDPLFGFHPAEHDIFDHSFMLQPAAAGQPSQPGHDHHDVAAGSLQGGSHHVPYIAHPTPRYAIPPAFYATWPTIQPPHFSHPLAAHSESPTIHQPESQTYTEPGSSHQPVIEPPTLDLALFDNSAPPSQSSVTIEASHFDDITRHTKIARRRGKVNGTRPVLKHAKRVGMERAQFSRQATAGTSSATTGTSSTTAGASSATAQNSTVMSSESDMKIVPGSGIRKLLGSLREGMKRAIFNQSILPASGSLSEIVDSSWKDVTNNQFSGTDRSWAQEMLNNKKYVDEKMGPVIDEISQEMTTAARFFTYHYCYIDFDDVAVVVEALAINTRASRIRGLVKDDIFLYGQLFVNGVDVGNIAFASETIIRMARYLLRDGPHQYHKYISQGNFGPLLIMIAMVTRWALQEHSTGFFVESQFSPEANIQHHARYLTLFNGLNPNQFRIDSLASLQVVMSLKSLINLLWRCLNMEIRRIDNGMPD